MSQSNNAQISELWRGEGVSDERDVLTCPSARFLAMGVLRGDLLELSRGDVTLRAGVLKVVGEEQVMFQVLDRTENSRQSAGMSDLPPGDFSVVLSRLMDSPCPICAEAGNVRELDHVHCVGCGAIVEYNNAGITNCEACIEKMRDRLVITNIIEETCDLFNGKRTIKIHGRSVAECDQIQEWQDDLMLKNQGITTQFVLDETKKVTVAFAVDDDGQGNSPLALVADMSPESTPIDRINVMLKHFKSFPAAYFNAVMTKVAQLDSLLEDACKYIIKDKPTQNELLALGEQVAIGPYPVLGTIPIWGGKETLVFCSPTLEALDDATAFAENFVRAHKDKMLEGRGKFVVTLARLAAHFRGDGKMRFDEKSTFDERLDYLLTLPMPLYYLYLAAGNVWQMRVHKASGAEVLGKS